MDISPYDRRSLFEAVPAKNELPSLRWENFEVLCKCETRLERYEILAILVREVVREGSYFCQSRSTSMYRQPDIPISTSSELSTGPISPMVADLLNSSGLLEFSCVLAKTRSSHFSEMT